MCLFCFHFVFYLCAPRALCALRGLCVRAFVWVFVLFFFLLWFSCLRFLVDSCTVCVWMVLQRPRAPSAASACSRLLCTHTCNTHIKNPQNKHNTPNTPKNKRLFASTTPLQNIHNSQQTQHTHTRKGKDTTCPHDPPRNSPQLHHIREFHGL